MVLSGRGMGAVADWVLAFDGYAPADERRREALCTAGNGYFATRGAWAGSEAGDHHYPGTYLAGYYNRLTDKIGDSAVENESLVNLPDWLPLTFAADDGDWWTPDTTEVLDHDLAGPRCTATPRTPASSAIASWPRGT
jgi:trehalose/maltose hydrolase-like predicted phosphorylase